MIGRARGLLGVARRYWSQAPTLWAGQGYTATWPTHGAPSPAASWNYGRRANRLGGPASCWVVEPSLARNWRSLLLGKQSQHWAEYSESIV
jgi:hypothetical protein